MHRKIGSIVLLCGALIWAGIAGGRPEQLSANSLAPAGFYASALAHDEKRGRYYIGSYQSGEVLILDRNGQFLQRLPATEGRRITRLYWNAKTQNLWVLSNRGIEAYATEALPAVRVLNRWSPGQREVSDMAVLDANTLLLLDAKEGRLLSLDRRSGAIRVLSSFADKEEAVVHTTRQCAFNSALLLRSEGRIALVAIGTRIWSVDLDTGTNTPMNIKVTGVSQLLRVNSDHVLAMQGERSHALLLRVDQQGRLQRASPLRLQATQAVHDRGIVRLLDGNLRHHPDFCGDGRPNVNPRLRSVALQMPSLEVAQH